MPDYSHRGGGRYGAVVAGRNIAAGRFVYLSKIDGMEKSWRIRDFLGKVILSSEDTSLKLSEIESLVDEDEPPPPYNAETEADKWAEYLLMRSKERFGNEFDGKSPPVLKGPWKPL